jgi:hypothetical protein
LILVGADVAPSPERRGTWVAALIGSEGIPVDVGAAVRVAGVDGGAVGEQRHGVRGAAIVLQRPKARLQVVGSGAHQVTVCAIREPGATVVVA